MIALGIMSKLFIFSLLLCSQSFVTVTFQMNISFAFNVNLLRSFQTVPCVIHLQFYLSLGVDLEKLP